MVKPSPRSKQNSEILSEGRENEATAIPARHRVPAHLARRFQQICLGLASEVTLQAGLTPVEFAVLAGLDDAPGLDQRRLASNLGIDPVTIHHILHRLEAAGLVARRVHPDDRRARLLHLTNDG